MTVTTFRHLYGEGIIFLTTSLFFTIFLFFIGEGHYSLQGILSLGNIVTLSLYFIGFFVGQWLLFYSFSEKMHYLKNMAYSIPLGLLLGLLISLVIMYTIRLCWLLAQ